MRRNLGYDMAKAEKEFFDSCDGTHEMNLIEVFERDGQDVMRAIDRFVPDAGELWLCDEDGMNVIVAAGWDYEPRECVGFSRAELIDMKKAGEI